MLLWLYFRGQTWRLTKCFTGSEWAVERLVKTHERGEFSCGKGSLDDFLRSLVSQYEKRRLGRTYVAVRPGDMRVLGYYTLAAGSVSFVNMPPQLTKKLPRHHVPTILLARLAVDESVQGQGLGGFLLWDSLHRCLSLAEQLDVHSVEVDAIDDEATAFYRHYGFIALLDNPLHLVLPIAVVEDSVGECEKGTHE